MATRSQKTKVGVFLTVCSVLIVGGLVYISGINVEERTSYNVEFNEPVLGLTVGGSVDYLGVPVGTVSDIRVTEEGFAHVIIGVKDSKVTLKEGVSAQLVMTSLATGILGISLAGGEGNRLPEWSEIPTRNSLVQSFTSGVDELMANVEDIVTALSTGLEGMEEGQLTDTVENADGLITDSREFIDTARETVEDLRDDVSMAIEDYRLLAQDMSKLSKELNELVATSHDKIEPVDLAAIAESADSALKTVDELATRLISTADLLDGVSGTLLHEMDNIEHSIRGGIVSFRDTLDAMKELASYLQQDPAALIRGRGEPERKEKK